MLFQRILAALILTPLAVVVILFPPNWLFALIVAAVFLGAQWEWTCLSGVRNTAARAIMLAVTLLVMAVLWWRAPRPGCGWR